MMNPDKQPPPQGVIRRDLLKILPIAGAGVCAAGAAGAEPSQAPQGDDPREVRLADTPHTRTYYKLARE